MPPPDDLLAALDPEQRQVAEALHGPVRVLAGAGTGKTRAITHRIAYGVATGVYQPTEVLAVTFTTRAAGEMRSRLRLLGAAGVQARTFHSAALRQLRLFWPHVHGTELPTLTESKLGMLAGAARRCRIPTDQALLRDLASEIEWAKVSNVHPDDYARVAARRGRQVAGHDARGGRPGLLPPTRTVKRNQGRMDMEDVLLFTAGMLADDERVAAQVRRQYKRFVVDEFQDVSPLQSALLDLWLGGRDELCVVGDPAQTIYSFAGARADYLRDFPHEVPRHHLASSWSATTAPPRRSSTGPTSCWPAPPSQGVALRAQRPAGPEVGLTAHPDEVAEAAAVADADPPARAPPGRRWARWRCCSGSTPSPSTTRRRSPSRGIPYVVRGAARFFDRAEVRQAVTLLRGTARGGQAAGECLRDRPGHPVRAGLDRRAAGDPGPGPRPLGVAAGAGRPGRRVRRGPAATSAASSTSSTAAPPSSTPPSPTASPSPPSTPPRAWSGTRCSSPALQDGTLPISLRRHPGRGRGGAAAALRRHDPGPGAPRDLLGAGAQPRRPAGPAALAVPRPGCCPRARSGRRPRPGGRARRTAASAASRSPARRRRSSAAAPTARPPTTRSCSSGCASGAATGRARTRCRRTSSSPTPRCSSSPSTSRDTESALLAITGVGRTKLERYGAEVLELCG